MITKIHLSPNEDLKPVVISWSEDEEDFIIESIPAGLSRWDLVALVDEIKRITEWEE